MSRPIDLEALALEHLQSEHFAEYLADAVKVLYNRQLMSEFDTKIGEAMDKKVKEVVLSYLTEIGEERIHKLVETAIRSISKEDLLEKLI